MRGDDFRSLRNELVFYTVKPAEGMECWRRKRCRVYRECGEVREMI